MEFLSSMITSFLIVIEQLGYFGIFLGMTIESSFIPFPSEIILIPAGALVAQGKMNFFFVLFAGLLGSLTGALINYFLALFLGRTTIDLLVSKYGKVFLLNKTKLKNSDEYFEKHGDITMFVGRLIPVVRQLISLPAGFSRMNLPKFCLFTGLGAGIWTLVLILIGYFFGSTISTELKLTITSAAILFSVILLLTHFIRKKK